MRQLFQSAARRGCRHRKDVPPLVRPEEMERLLAIIGLSPWHQKEFARRYRRTPQELRACLRYVDEGLDFCIGVPSQDEKHIEPMVRLVLLPSQTAFWATLGDQQIQRVWDEKQNSLLYRRGRGSLAKLKEIKPEEASPDDPLLPDSLRFWAQEQRKQIGQLRKLIENFSKRPR